MKFEWDPEKANSNLRKHKVSFEEAATELSDPMAATGADPDHSIGEERYITFGVSERGRLLVVAHTEEGETVRIISARVASKGERKYMKKVKQTDRDELRTEYKTSDFPEGLVRGKYAKRVRESSNIFVPLTFPLKVFLKRLLIRLSDLLQHLKPL